jgi:phytoene desaturase
MRTVVIGAGFGGLSAAAHLVAAGHEVTVVERSARAGGRAAAVVDGGFSLDLGPTVFTMPHLLEDAFGAVGASMSDHVTIRPVDPIYRAVFADGSELRVRAGRTAMTQEVREFAGDREAGVFNEFCDWVTDLYELQMPNFIDTNFDSVVDALRPWRAAVDLIRAGGFRRLDRKVASFFEDERLRRVFSFQSMYAGVAPHRALALYSVLTYMDTVAGVYSVDGGLHTAARSLARVIERAGATFEYGSTVARILRDGTGTTSGVELDNGERRHADAVVCNADLPIAYRTLIGGIDAPRVARRGTYSPSCVVWSAGVGAAAPTNAALHNLHFGAAWEEAFDDITRRGRLMAEPSMLVSVPSLGDATRAPSGSSTLLALEPVPNLDGKVDWVRDGERIADRLRRRVADVGYPVDDVRVERIIGPLEWERQGLERGTPFALAHTRRQTGPLRPANHDDRIPGLFFAGSSTLPGVGVPMVLVSGKLAAERAARYASDTSTVKW